MRHRVALRFLLALVLTVSVGAGQDVVAQGALPKVVQAGGCSG